MEFYPIQKRWKKLGPLYRSPEATAIWHPEMEAYSFGRAEDYGYPFRPRPLTPDLRPEAYDSCDWRWCQGRRGPQPHFWEYTCHAACHWVAPLHLWVAQQAEPDRQWRLVSSNAHSTIWDGKETLFDGNFLALGISPEETWELAARQADSEIYPVGVSIRHDSPPDSAS